VQPYLLGMHNEVYFAHSWIEGAVNLSVIILKSVVSGSN